MTSPQKCHSSEVNRTAAKFNKAELARVYFFSPFKSLSLLLGLFFSVCQSRDKLQKCSTIQINGHWSCIKANFLSCLIYETFLWYYFLQSAVCIYNTALLPLRNGTLLHLSFNWNQSSKCCLYWNVRVIILYTCSSTCCACCAPMVGRLTDGQAEPNPQSKYQGGRMIGKVGPVRQGIFKHERLTRLQICNSITEHIRRHSTAFRSRRTHTVLHAGTDTRSRSWCHWVSMCRDLILLWTILHNKLKNVKAAQRRTQNVFVWCVKERC